MTGRTRLGMGLLLSCVVMMGIASPPAFALIFGGEGNAPVGDPGWPKGAAAIFNVKARIAWWEGPPLGGGQWHAECRGDAKAISAVLADFAKLDVKDKRIVLHDGFGNSFWLNGNDQPPKREAGRMDWRFMVWLANHRNAGHAQLDIYTGGNIKWVDVVVPKGLKITDQRLEARGFSVKDGVVVEGKLTDLATKKPLAAQVRLERLKQHKDGSYGYVDYAKSEASVEGRWVLKKVAAEGSYRVIIEGSGYVPRVLGYFVTNDQPRWHSYDGGLARPATVAGRVTDGGQPLADVEVRLDGATASDGSYYERAVVPTIKTNKDGRFRAEGLPIGGVNVWVHKPGYIRPGLRLSISTPKEDVELSMIKAGRIVVTVDFTGKERPKGYIVQIAPEEGAAVGSYSGSGQINDKNQISFDYVPPGRYVVRGRPNPGADNQQTEPVAAPVMSGQTAEIKITAK
jgi:hypothetical protein